MEDNKYSIIVIHKEQNPKFDRIDFIFNITYTEIHTPSYPLLDTNPFKFWNIIKFKIYHMLSNK